MVGRRTPRREEAPQRAHPEGDETPEDAIVVLKDPQLEGDKRTYTVDMLEGSLPDKGELVSVFIDPFGRPLSPVSLAGMNRRARRR